MIYKPTQNFDVILDDYHFKNSFINNSNIFLAGSIEMGSAEEWQKIVEDEIDSRKVNIWNPRRDEWDSSWEQSIINKKFVQQVDWEIKALDYSDIIFMYLAPDTMSPISLLELGMYAKSGKLMVCCPDGFKRKGNVEIVCAKYDVPTYDSLEKAIAALKLKL